MKISNFKRFTKIRDLILKLLEKRIDRFWNWIQWIFVHWNCLGSNTMHVTVLSIKSEHPSNLFSLVPWVFEPLKFNYIRYYSYSDFSERNIYIGAYRQRNSNKSCVEHKRQTFSAINRRLPSAIIINCWKYSIIYIVNLKIIVL